MQLCAGATGLAGLGDLAMGQEKASMIQEKLLFRKAQFADIPEIVQLVNSAYRGDSSRSGWTTEADLLSGQRTDLDEVKMLISNPDSLILLAEMQNGLVGTAHLKRVHESASIGMLVIRPGLQGCGLGKQLLAVAEETAISHWRINMLCMHVISLRTELIEFYLRRGYQQTGKYMPFPQDVRYGIPQVRDLQLELLEKCVVL